MLRKVLACAVALVSAAMVLTAQSAARELRLSHQLPESDARHRAARVLALEADVSLGKGLIQPYATDCAG